MNRLAGERSPYLLQHANNPVDWFAWGEEAFAKARREDKPIFLSIGYSTCHWCHVMEHESFENREIADVLNERFVSIKVDREERPDVDRVYMTFVQSTTGSGGWPMSVFLTPALKPFYGGTYFPPVSRWGRPGFIDLLQEIKRVWTEDRARVDYAAAELFDRLKAVAGADGRQRSESTLAGPEQLAEAVVQYQAAYDQLHGGFGDSPKFPRPSELLFLLREYARTGAESQRMMAVETLRAMALGGMRDQIGGGFHRYSVDGEWRVPHFEKMLYDQAQLAIAYLEAAQATGDQFFAAVAEDTLAYVRSEMRHPEGGFYSAEDADSPVPDHPDEKREGAFYVWTDAEIGALLGADADVFRLRFGVRPEGNAPADPQGEFAGQNLLYTAASIDTIVRESRREFQEVVAALARARQVLFEARASRPRPHRDDKIITAWNGMMIAAFARAARVMPDRPEAAAWHETAAAAAKFVERHLWNPPEKRLLRSYRQGSVGIDAFADDYACLIWGLLELFQADGDPSWLTWARELQATQNALFWDEADGAWFSTTGRDPSVLLRLKEDYDGAEPAASSISVMNLLTLAHLTEEEGARAKAQRSLERYGPRAGQAARAIPFMFGGLSAWHAGMSQIVIVGDSTDAATIALKRAAGRRYLPFAVLIPVDPQRWHAERGQVLPLVSAMHAKDGRPTAFVCRDFTCREPVTEPEALEAQLRA